MALGVEVSTVVVATVVVLGVEVSTVVVATVVVASVEVSTVVVVATVDSRRRGTGGQTRAQATLLTCGRFRRRSK